MKNLKISLAAIALLVVVVVSLTSCSVEYRTRHPRHHKVIVVGMEKSHIPVDSTNTVLSGKSQVADNTMTTVK